MWAFINKLRSPKWFYAISAKLQPLFLGSGDAVAAGRHRLGGSSLRLRIISRVIAFASFMSTFPPRF